MSNVGQKSVQILIDSDQLEELKHDGYKLCFAKKVGDVYNVVWQSYDKYLGSCTFGWTPTYDLFGTNTFDTNVNVTVKADTNTVPILLGQTSVLDDAGVLGDAFSGGPSTGITLTNNYGSIHPGVSSYSIGIDGKAATTPIYVAEKAIVSGSDTLTPVESVLVWFDQTVQTSSMFSEARSKSVEIDLTNDNTAVRKYSGGVWITPPSGALSGAASLDPFGILTIITSLTSQISLTRLSAQLSAAVQAIYRDIELTITTPGGVQVVINFNARRGLTGARQAQAAALLSDPAKVDILCSLTLDVLATMGVGYTDFQAIAV